MSDCSTPGLPVFQLQTPVSSILDSKLHVALIQNKHIAIDLDTVQQKVSGKQLTNPPFCTPQQACHEDFVSI